VTKNERERMSQALKRDYCIVAEFYCDAESWCPSREITLRMKFLEKRIPPKDVKCPLCGTPMKMHWVKTSAEKEVSQ
jgi:hypothetical protein